MTISPHPKAQAPEADAGAPRADFDVVVIGGGFAGASLALLLRRWRPQTRILVVDYREDYDRKVGEATVEVSAVFLHRVLGLYDYLSREHLPKHGLRYWFASDGDSGLEEMTEIGPKEVPTLPSFQLDRSKLDRDLLAMARDEGTQVEQPARVRDVELGWPISRLAFETADGQRQVTARWVVDASGRHAFLAKRLGLHERVEEHPTAAVWGRWRGVADLDGPEVLGDDCRRSRLPDLSASRRLATNHFCGWGWWCWVIPLASGQTSIGLVWHKELFALEGEGDLRTRFEAFLRRQPGLRELVADASLEEDDWLAYSHLPYRSRRYMDRGWALVGDSASFLDPYYSPGLDHASISVYATARILEEYLGGSLEGDTLEGKIREHNENFHRAYDRWLDALYRGKYEILGDAELTACAFLVDTALYYMGVVTPIYNNIEVLRNPPFGVALPQARWAYKTLRTFNRRLQTLAGHRRRLGLYGRRNGGWRSLSPAFRLGAGSAGHLRRGILLWLHLEWETLRGRIFGGRRATPTATLSAPEALETDTLEPGATRG